MKHTHNILLFSIITAFYGSNLQAQVTTHSVFYNELQNLNNPAAVGTESGHNISISLRNQWLQSANNDSPQIQTLSTTHSITDRIGLGASVVRLEETYITLMEHALRPIIKVTTLICREFLENSSLMWE